MPNLCDLSTSGARYSDFAGPIPNSPLRVYVFRQGIAEELEEIPDLKVLAVDSVELLPAREATERLGLPELRPAILIYVR